MPAPLELLEEQVKSGLIQGGVAASTRSEKIAAAGLQNVHPEAKAMTERSRFDIASAGKVFTAGCTALLIEAGKLDPDAPFVKYIPEYCDPESPITVRDLAMHCSGFDNSKPYDGISDPELFRKALFGKRPVRPRLEAFEYACSNMILLGMIAERITGKGLDDLARELLWAPLGMNRTRWTAPGPGPDEVEHWFPNRPAGQHNDPTCFTCPFPLGSGSCFSTVHDMTLFAKDVQERRLFPESYYRLIGTCGFDKDGNRRSFGWDMTDANRPAGLSRSAIFHSGWTGQTICVDPENDFAAVVLTSRTGDWQEGYDGRNRIIEAMFQNKQE